MFEKDIAVLLWDKCNRRGVKVVRTKFRGYGALLCAGKLQVKTKTTLSLLTRDIVTFSCGICEKLSALRVEREHGSAGWKQTLIILREPNIAQKLFMFTKAAPMVLRRPSDDNGISDAR